MPVKNSDRKQKNGGGESPGSPGSKTPQKQTQEYIEKINALSEKVYKYKKEREEQEITVSGLKRNVDLLTSNAQRDRRTIDTLRRQLKVLQEGDSIT